MESSPITGLPEVMGDHAGDGGIAHPAFDAPDAPEALGEALGDDSVIALPPGVVDVDKFRCHRLDVVEAYPDEDAVSTPQCILVMEGTPAELTITGQKSYITALDGATAMALGRQLLEAGKRVVKAAREQRGELEAAVREAQAGPSLVTATPADIAAAAMAARAAADLAKG